MSTDEINRTIDTKIEDGTLTNDEYDNYITTHCWYCGAPLEENHNSKKIKLSRSKILHLSAEKLIFNIPECSECHKFHTKEKHREWLNTSISLAAALPASNILDLILPETVTEILEFAGMEMFDLTFLLLIPIISKALSQGRIVMREKFHTGTPDPVLRPEEAIPMVKEAKSNGFRKIK